MDTKPPGIAVITGPTATGKTKLGVELALTLGGEVVSADSMQIYRGMNIGTAKPTQEETRGIPHHMIDIADPTEDYSAARYVEEASEVISGILDRGRLPIVVGGTGLYIDSLISGRSFASIADDGSTRRELEKEYDSLGGDEMLRLLSEFDPDRAKKLYPADKKRIVRAHEVYRLTGETITAHDERTKRIPPRYDARRIALSFENREDLYRRIDLRVDEMMGLGLEAEVKALLESGVSPDATSMQAMGYREFLPYFRGEIDLCEVSRQIKQNSRRYAKRQLTWLRGKEDVKWVLWRGEPDFAAAGQISTKYCMDSVIE